MKTKIALVALAVLGFTACSDSDPIDEAADQLAELNEAQRQVVEVNNQLPEPQLAEDRSTSYAWLVWSSISDMQRMEQCRILGDMLSEGWTDQEMIDKVYQDSFEYNIGLTMDDSVEYLEIMLTNCGG